MRRGWGVQAEVLASLTVVMVTATALLFAMLAQTHASQIESLRTLVGRALAAEAHSSALEWIGGSDHVRWWIVRDGVARRLGGHEHDVDRAGLAFAKEATSSDAPVVRVGQPWHPTRFAVRLPDGRGVALAFIAPAAPAAVIVAVVVCNGVVFIALGAYLLRGRVVLPLRHLAESARAIGEGERGLRVAVEGEGEAAEVACAFNDMTEALERRGNALEKAVAELRRSNRDLSRARDGLDRAERLASVGSLAAGVAHEVGNPMGALLAFLELARRDESLDPETSKLLDRASEQGGRVREILRQLLDFSRPPQVASVAVDLHLVVEQTIALIRAQQRYADVRFEVDVPESLPPIRGDRSMISQILLNLLINGAQAALAVERPPRIHIAIREAPLIIRAGEDREAAAGRRSVDGVECVVSDSGDGVSDPHRERIFDPFFTTKDPGEGTGLGLANSLRLAEEQGGTVELEGRSALEGAALALRLPKYQVEAGELMASARQASSRPARSRD